MIDFGDVLNDAEMGAESLVCQRRAATVGDNGRNTIVESSVNFTGIVTQDAAAVMERVGESSYIKGSILVTTGFQLRLLGAGIETDVVIWRGKRYAANVLSDYNLHGVNWAVCVPDGVQL